MAPREARSSHGFATLNPRRRKHSARQAFSVCRSEIFTRKEQASVSRPEEVDHAIAWSFVSKLGGQHCEDGGRTNLAVRRLGRIVLVKEREVTVHIFDDVAAAVAFVTSLAPVEEKIIDECLVEAEGFVALWVDAPLDPKGMLDGKDGPIGWFDHDDWEANRGTPAEVIPKFLYGASFADAATARAQELVLASGSRVDALYEDRLSSPRRAKIRLLPRRLPL